jgi:hypothetical protein
MIVAVAQPAVAATRQLTPSEKQLISTSFGRALKDPQSAQYNFPPVVLVELNKNREMPFCFRLNAKNAFGGYVGYKTILATLTIRNRQIVAFDYVKGLNDETPELAATTRDLCALFGFHF